MAISKKSLEEIYAGMAADARTRAPQLTDFEEGSVVRSLLESVSAEMVLLYEQLDLVYQSGFVDTAQGANLDRVVAVLGLKRDEPDYATGTVTFTRDAGSAADLTVPIGTLVTTEEKPAEQPAKKAYVTTQSGLLQAGKDSIDVPVQAAERGRQMTSDGGTVVVMPRPVAGVKSVSNGDPIRFLGRDRESDDALRQRAKQALLASGRASVTSIENALLGMPGVRDVVVQEAAQPGSITVYVDGLDGGNSAAIRQRLDEVRAAGILASLKPAVPVNVDAVLQIEVNSKVGSEERATLEERARDAVIYLIDSLPMGRPLLFSQLAAALLQVSGVNDLVRFEMSTFLETDASATGKVTMRRAQPPMASSLTVPADTRIQTAPGQLFRLIAEVTLPDMQTEVTADVAAVNPGRDGELSRTGSAANWMTLTLNATVLTPDNADPILLPRTTYQLTDRLVPAEVLQRLRPNRIRAASEIKPLKVRVLMKLQDGTGADAKRPAIEKAVKAFFVELSAKTDRTFLKSDLEQRLSAVTPAPGPFELHLLAMPFQSESPQDDFRVERSFVEKPEAEIIFVYHDAVYLAGNITLVLSLTALAADKSAAIGAARQAISDYLDGLQPEQDLSPDEVQRAVSTVAKVLRVEFVPENCTLLDGQGNIIADRLQGTRLSVKAFEKAFLSADKFVVQA